MSGKILIYRVGEGKEQAKDLCEKASIPFISILGKVIYKGWTDPQKSKTIINLIYGGFL